MTSELTNKKQLRVALVGVTPADQVTLKGYMRVLLRLDVNLEWVSAADGAVGLFMINNDFRNAESVARLLDINQGVPVLYIANSPTGEGSLQNNIITLPLRQIGLLSDWLTQNVPILFGINPTIAGTTSSTPISPQPEPTTLQASLEQARTISVGPSLQTIIDLIEKLHSRSKSLFEIVENGTPIAIIDSYRQVAWVQSTQTALNEQWQLRPYQGGIPSNMPQDANAWLWSMAWKNPNVITSLIDNHSRYQLRYWVKPTQDKRELLQIMTAMESTPLSVTEIAAKAGVSVTTTKNAIASLLLSGNLTADSYKEIKVQSNMQPTPPVAPQTIQSNDNSPATHTTPPKPVALPAPEQEEKMGFLARLRKKLGLL